jgi:hypothetical protein
LGIPDPLKTRITIGGNINNPQDRGNLWAVNPHIERRYAVQQGDQGIATERGLALTSNAMQEQTKNMQTSLAEMTEESLKTAISGQNLTSTQDVVKANLEMQAQQSMVLTNIAVEQLNQKHETGITHLQLANISKEIDKQTHQRLNDKAVAIGRLSNSLSKVRLK